MIANKWINVALGLAVALLGYFSTVDWATLLPTQAGTIVSAIGVLKIILGAIAPPNGQSMFVSTGGAILTHN